MATSSSSTPSSSQSTTALFNGFVLPRSEMTSTWNTHSVDALYNSSRRCFLASLRNCIVPNLTTRHFALLLDVDLIVVCRLDEELKSLKEIHDIKFNVDSDDNDNGSDSNGEIDDGDDVESGAWGTTDDGGLLLLIVLKTRSFSIFDTSTFTKLSSRSLYFHALDVACFPLAQSKCAVDCQCTSNVEIRDESTAAWHSGLVVAVAGADGLQLFHVCTHRRVLTGRFVVVHEFLNIARVCVSHDASLLAVISVIGHVGVWRLAGGVGVQRTDNFWFHLVDDCERLVDVAFDTANAQLAVTSWDGSLRVFERVNDDAQSDFCNSWRLVVPDYLTYVDVKHRAGQIAAPLTAVVGANEALLTRDNTLVHVDIRSAAPMALFQFDSAVRGLVALGGDGGETTVLCATADGTVRKISGVPRPCST